jgi:benzoyl-CoA reductase/2-hydroxyglutaryl-CoA dehydratase subunit BcrC/BadD/HgdB
MSNPLVDSKLRRILYRSMTRDGLRLPLPVAFQIFQMAVKIVSLVKVRSVRTLEREYLNYYREGLTSDQSVWTSIFVPTEILYAFGLSPLCLEGLSALFASMGIAKNFLGRHGTHFVPNTMCNFHRLSIDIASSGVLPKPRFVLSSSALCDGNIKTFRHLAEKAGVPFFFLDIPQNDDQAGVAYLVSQLQELIGHIETLTGKTMDQARLDAAAQNIAITGQLMETIYRLRCRLQRNVYYGHQMINFMLPLAAMSGSDRLIKICRTIIADLEDGRVYNRAFPPEISPETIKIIWAHIAPVFQYNDIWPFIDDGVRSKVYLEECTGYMEGDINSYDALEIIARRLIKTPGNGPLERRLNSLEKIYADTGADGIVHFSHWGCHQASGVTPLLQKHFSERDIPFLNVNGDCVDARSCGLEQHKTRYSAFLESLAAKKKRKLK